MNGDPWCERESSDQKSEETQGQEEKGVTLEFEDSFKPEEKAEPTLADSEEYLNRLETKLKRLQSKREAENQEEGQLRKDLLCSFDTARESCMLRYLSRDSDTPNSPSVVDSEVDLDAPIANSQLLRLVAPERQALVSGELVELLKADELACATEAPGQDTELKSTQEEKS